jgi:hypothetical protein
MSGQARVWGADGANQVIGKAERPALAMPRVLVIDSDNLHRMIICRAADKAGYIPAGAANFTEAAKLTQTVVFDCEAPLLIVGNRDAAGFRETLRFARSLGLNVGEPLAKPVDVGLLRYALEQMKVERTLQRGLAAVGA